MTNTQKPDTLEVKGKKVTATRTIEFPAFNWSIEKGETRELPVDEVAQKEILTNKHIRVIK